MADSGANGISTGLIGTTRRMYADLYASKPAGTWRASTKPYKSRLPFTWLVVNPLAATGATGTTTTAVTAFAKLTKGQEREFFGFGVGQSIALGTTTNLQKQATQSDTNQSTQKATNGVEDFAIEGISSSLSGVRIEYGAADTTVALLTGVTDTDVKDAFIGKLEILDPGTLMSPPQLSSPFNLEQLFHDGMKSNTAISFEWDSGVKKPIGTLDQIPEGGAKSYLKASGVPSTQDRFQVPEGYAWRAKSRTDGDFVTRATVTDTVVCPLNLVSLMGLTPGAGTVGIPLAMQCDLTIRVHGLGFGNLSNNE